jgi:mRNA deadenylase 3'-5' endonuclease subunit Ccr4
LHPAQQPIVMDVFSVQDNVALIAVLEALDVPIVDGAQRRQMICVANTHIHANKDMNDVKLWQVHTLLKGLEKIAARLVSIAQHMSYALDWDLCSWTQHTRRTVTFKPTEMEEQNCNHWTMT